VKKHSNLTTVKQRTQKMIFSLGGRPARHREPLRRGGRVPPNEKKSLPSGLLGGAAVVERSAASRCITNAKRRAHWEVLYLPEGLSLFCPIAACPPSRAQARRAGLPIGQKKIILSALSASEVNLQTREVW
jgi:hypothetical protein